MKAARLRAVAGLACLAACGAAVAQAALPGTADDTPAARAVAMDAIVPPVPKGLAPDIATLADKGRYLALAADCAACHTAAAGKPFAGGYSIQSPLGVIVATNITPSRTAGIGDYDEAAFARALRQGVRADGAHLYPAMPYTAYTGLSDEDTRALYTYFMHAVAPVDQAPEPTRLPFPFNIRASMAAWNLLFLDDRRFVPDASASAQVNRGAYLGQALAHCSTCHTPRNALMAERDGQLLGGGALGPWYAPNITPDGHSGIGSWSDAEVAQYLRSGHIARSQAAGPMAEAVEKSFQYLRGEDITALVAWLRTVPPLPDPAQARPVTAQGRPYDPEPQLRGSAPQTARDSLHDGAALFSAYCASCHQAGGQGSRDGAYPSLLRNTATGRADPSNLVAAMLFGVERTVGGRQVLMPRFDHESPLQPLTDMEIASIANHVLSHYGDATTQVDARRVREAREGGPRPFLAKVQPMLLPLAIAVLVLVLAAALAWWLLRRGRSA